MTAAMTDKPMKRGEIANGGGAVGRFRTVSFGWRLRPILRHGQQDMRSLPDVRVLRDELPIHIGGVDVEHDPPS